ncbi:MAG: EVE domain-containing protein [Cyanobacteria bacterium J06576_12]
MDQPTYWLCLFNATTWPEFLAAGGDTIGFPNTQHKTIFRIKPGDHILAYMTKASKWIASMEVTSDPYFDTETRIWTQATFPCRVKVKLQFQLDPAQGIPVLDLAPKLKLFDNLKSPTHWGLLFRTAPRELSSEDGQLIIQAIQHAQK